MGKEEGTHTEPGHGAPPESDTSKGGSTRAPEPYYRQRDAEAVNLSASVGALGVDVIAAQQLPRSGVR